ncbi:hypothetical protein VM98_24895 [Streptomyces rubellomurinus subsp. indigoferus]|nr:hypothetical protein VM98_24895 [Streptomyces rubellomurinus subsp. indigoferus]
MSGNLALRGMPEPEPPRGRRTRAERERLRAVHLEAEVDRLKAVAQAQVEHIQAAGRAQLHADRVRYAGRLTTAAASEFAHTHRTVTQLLDGQPYNQMLTIGEAQIEAAGLSALCSHIADHERDGRSRFGG